VQASKKDKSAMMFATLNQIKDPRDGKMRDRDKPDLQHSATLCNSLQHSATRCNTLQHVATLATFCHCNTLQYTATHTKESIQAQITVASRMSLNMTKSIIYLSQTPIKKKWELNESSTNHELHDLLITNCQIQIAFKHFR